MIAYTFFWLDGTKEEFTGESAIDALRRSGYGHGAVRALDFAMESSKAVGYIWNGRKWTKKVEANNA